MIGDILEIHGARHDHQIGLPGGIAKDFGAEAVGVIAVGGGGHHLDGAAGYAERERPEGIGARQIERFLQREEAYDGRNAFSGSGEPRPGSTGCGFVDIYFQSRTFFFNA